MVLFVFDVTLCVSVFVCVCDCLCFMCLCMTAKLHSPYGTPIESAKHLSRTSVKVTRTPAYATRTPKCISGTPAKIRGHSIDRTPAGKGGNVAICRTHVGRNRMLTSYKVPRARSDYVGTSAAVDSSQAAITTTTATTQEIQAVRVSDSSSNSAVSDAVVENGLQTVTTVARKPREDVARRLVRGAAKRPMTNISRRPTIGSQVPELSGKSSAMGNITRRKRGPADN